MIKLKNILNEVFEETIVKEYGSSSGSHELTIDQDGIYIPGLLKDTDLIELSVTVNYDYNPGSPARGMFGSPSKSDPGEGASVDLGPFHINDITIKFSDGNERTVDPKFLHAEQKKILINLVQTYLDRNNEDIISKILDDEG